MLGIITRYDRLDAVDLDYRKKSRGAISGSFNFNSRPVTLRIIQLKLAA